MNITIVPFGPECVRNDSDWSVTTFNKLKLGAVVPNGSILDAVNAMFYILFDKNMALASKRLVPYQKALKLVLSVKTITRPRPILWV